jgi:hypothetical protein
MGVEAQEARPLEWMGLRRHVQDMKKISQEGRIDGSGRPKWSSFVIRCMITSVNDMIEVDGCSNDYGSNDHGYIANKRKGEIEGCAARLCGRLNKFPSSKYFPSFRGSKEARARCLVRQSHVYAG